MEIIASTIAVLGLLVAAALIGTRGRPARLLPPLRRGLGALAENRRPVVFLAAGTALGATFAYLLYVYPTAAMGPAQPIAFSHRVHAGVKQIDCRFCHPYAGRSTYPGVPPVEKCLFCHEHIIANHPEIRKEHRYFNTNTPTPWRKVNFLPEHVMFNHEPHIRKDVECAACHGQVEKRDRLKGRAFEMGFCLECHRRKEANLDCWLACHN